MKIASLFTILILVTSITTSCKNHLSTTEAKEQIIAAEHYPIITEYSFPKEFSKDFESVGNEVNVVIDSDELTEAIKSIEKFERNRLVTCKETPHREESTRDILGTTIKTWTTVTVSLTDEGRKYLLRENDETITIKLCEKNLADVTDIKEIRGSKSMRVNYTVSNQNITPFGRCFSINEGLIQKDISFLSTDDGWKINK